MLYLQILTTNTHYHEHHDDHDINSLQHHIPPCNDNKFLYRLSLIRGTNPRIHGTFPSSSSVITISITIIIITLQGALPMVQAS